MPRKDQGWITFQTSEEERHLLEEVCQVSQRTKTEVLREMLRRLKDSNSESADSNSEPTEVLKAEPASPQTVRSQREDAPPSPKKSLKVSSRNVLKGKITKIVKGSVNSEITLEIVHVVELTSIITTSSAEALELEAGKDAYAVIKSNDVVIAME